MICVLLSIQTSMSVRMVTTTVVRMQPALTQREVSPAPATLATLEMESTAQVCYYVCSSVLWLLISNPLTCRHR